MLISEEEKLKKKIMHKMIERKYYKKPQEVCLLTWDAKEQIRFLNNEYPDEWTVDRLAESFPTSREGIIKILKSRFQPKSLAEIVKHDERVHRNWKQLQDGKTKGVAVGGPITSRYLLISSDSLVDNNILLISLLGWKPDGGISPALGLST